MAKPKRGKVETLALLLCLEVYRLEAGRTTRWHNTGQVQETLGIASAVALDAWRYAKDKRWIETSHDDGEGVGMVHLLGDGRQRVAAALNSVERGTAPSRKPPPPSRGR